MSLRRLFVLPALFLTSLLPSHAALLTEDTPVYSSKDKKVGTLRRGAQVEVVEDAGEWLRVTYETMDATFDGYVRKASVSQAEGAPASPAPARTPPAESGPEARTPEEPRPAEPGAKPAAPVPPPVPGRELALSTSWQNGARAIPQSVTDFLNLLNDFGEAKVTLKPARNYYVYRRFEYLSSVAEALKTLGGGRVTTEALKAPGLPSDSFTGSSVDGYFDGFERIMLIGDRKGQLVAVQLSDRSDRDVWLRHIWWDEKQDYKKRVEYSDRWRLVNLFEGRTKGNSAWQLGYAFAQSDGLLRIDGEMIAGAEWQGRSRERHRTYLPQPIVDLMLQMLTMKN